MAKAKSYQKKQRTALTSVYIILTILAVFWMFPIVWIILTSFRGEGGAFVPYIIPKTFTLENYKVLLTNQTGNFPFVRWFLNTLFVSIASCLLSTFITIAMAYALSRLRFRLRKPFLKVALVLNMFPGFMSMIAVYYILKALNLTESLFALILVYSAGSALGFYRSTAPEKTARKSWCRGWSPGSCRRFTPGCIRYGSISGCMGSASGRGLLCRRCRRKNRRRRCWCPRSWIWKN